MNIFWQVEVRNRTRYISTLFGTVFIGCVQTADVVQRFTGGWRTQLLLQLARIVDRSLILS